MRSANVQRSLMLMVERDELALQTLLDVLDVEVAYAEPEQQWLLSLSLPVGATVADALAAVAHREPFVGLALAEMPVGIFGEVVARTQVLQAFDRVELYRALHQDPKTARRLRAAQAG